MSTENSGDHDAAPQIEPTFSSGKKNGATRSKTTVSKPKLPLLQQLIRFALVIAILAAAQLVTLSVTSYGMYRYGSAAIFFTIGVAIFVLSAVVLKRQIASMLARAEPSRAEPSRAEPATLCWRRSPSC